MPMDKSTPVDKAKLSDSKLKEIQQAFLLLDKDKDGKINSQEIKEMMEVLGINTTDDHVKHVMRRAGVEENGLISETEFVKFMDSFAGSPNEDEDLMEDLLAAFRVFDKDKNGFISKSELKEAMQVIGEPLTDKALDELVKAADLDNDGRINYEEFARLLL